MPSKLCPNFNHDFDFGLLKNWKPIDLFKIRMKFTLRIPYTAHRIKCTLIVRSEVYILQCNNLRQMCALSYFRLWFVCRLIWCLECKLYAACVCVKLRVFVVVIVRITPINNQQFMQMIIFHSRIDSNKVGWLLFWFGFRLKRSGNM